MKVIAWINNVPNIVHHKNKLYQINIDIIDITKYEIYETESQTTKFNIALYKNKYKMKPLYVCVPYVHKIKKTPKKLKILTYNICYQCIKGISRGSVNIKCPTQSNSNLTLCATNILKYIDDNGPYNIIGLQEVQDYNKLISNSSVLKSMCYSVYKYSELERDEPICTFWNAEHYTIENVYGGKMQDSGRPIHILFFKENLCVINFHAGHHIYDKLDQTSKPDVLYLDTYINNLKMTNEDKHKLQTYQIIILCDCNADLSDLQNIKNRLLYNKTPEKTYTCCDTKLKGELDIPLVIDHIVTTFPQHNLNLTIPKPTEFHSDHLPLIKRMTHPLIN